MRNKTRKTKPALDPLSMMLMASESITQASIKYLQRPEYLTKVANDMATKLAINDEALQQAKKIDKRFKAPEWDSNPFSQFYRDSYLVYSTFIKQSEDIIGNALDVHEKRDLQFFTNQYLNALSPSNFPWLNPEVIAKTFQSGGQNLYDGVTRYLQDYAKGVVRNTDTNAFQVGKNIAVTEGKVIYTNHLMELIQYNPSTSSVYQVPLLIIPPWINKYYIFDLQPHNSFVKWAVNQGHTVFIVSWKNPDYEDAHNTFQDYMEYGPITAFSKVQEASNCNSINLIGHCIGGVLLSCVLASMDCKFVNSLSLFTTPLDFSKAHDLLFFTNPKYFAKMEKKIQENGFLDAKTMEMTFNLMRPNDLIWKAFVNNYLLAKEPPAFDMLYWNSDSTNIPGEMLKFYIKNMFQDNALMKPGSISLFDTTIDLSNINVPSFVLGAREDHIAPWESTFAAMKFWPEVCKFVLAGSGHISGVINPPSQNKYSYWTSDIKTSSADEWLESAIEQPGSWWNEWCEWVTKLSGNEIDSSARIPESNLDPAPGNYVQKRS